MQGGESAVAERVIVDGNGGVRDCQGAGEACAVPKRSCSDFRDGICHVIIANGCRQSDIACRLGVVVPAVIVPT